MSVGRAFHRRGAAELEARSKTSTRYEQFRICHRAQISLTLKCEDWLQHVGDGRIHVGTGMDLPTQTVCWPMAIVAGLWAAEFTLAQECTCPLRQCAGLWPFVVGLWVGEFTLAQEWTCPHRQCPGLRLLWLDCGLTSPRWHRNGLAHTDSMLAYGYGCENFARAKFCAESATLRRIWGPVQN